MALRKLGRAGSRSVAIAGIIVASLLLTHTNATSYGSYSQECKECCCPDIGPTLAQITAGFNKSIAEADGNGIICRAGLTSAVAVGVAVLEKCLCERSKRYKRQCIEEAVIAGVGWLLVSTVDTQCLDRTLMIREKMSQMGDMMAN